MRPKVALDALFPPTRQGSELKVSWFRPLQCLNIHYIGRNKREEGVDDFYQSLSETLISALMRLH